MPLFRHRRLRKRWHYIALWSPELIVCANVVKVGPLRQEYWGVWDRAGKRLWNGTHAFRHRVHPMADRLVVEDSDVRIDVALGPIESFEAYRPEGRAYIWGRKDYGEYAIGTIRLGAESRRFEGAVFVDFSAGYYARRTMWRWMAGSGTDSSGRRVSWTGIVGLLDTPEASERALWAGGPGAEIGPVSFSDDLTSMAFAEGGSILFEEEAVLTIRRNFLIRSNYAHAFGRYSGTLPGGIELPEGFGVRERFDGVVVTHGCPDRPGSASPEELGFSRKPMVRWFGPSALWSSRLVPKLSTLVGTYSGKREIQAALNQPGAHNYSNEDELWIDFVADLGDGFDSTYTVASLLAAESIEVEAQGGQIRLPRGRLLVMGGDQVYPAASPARYRDKFLGPYRAALPCSAAGSHPHLFAIPGNHDWYDGLASFAGIFMAGRWVGGWQTRQGRSYFAIRLPHGWWLWGIDIQLSEYVDEPQLAYFRQVASEQVRPGERIILVTAKPSWIHEGLEGDRARVGELDAVRNLSYVERTVIEGSGARVAVMLSGDLHHYARYESADGARQKITAGGGGSYLYPTHDLPRTFVWPEAGGSQPYRRAAVFPEERRSRALAKASLLLPFANRSFWALLSVVDLWFAWMLQFALRLQGAGLASTMKAASLGDLWRATLRSPGCFLLVLVMLLAWTAFADTKTKWGKLMLGGGHGVAQVAVLLLSIWGASRVGAGGAVFVLAFLAVVGIGGGLAGSLVLGAYLFVAHRLFRRHPNEVFASQHLDGYGLPPHADRHRRRPDDPSHRRGEGEPAMAHSN